MSSRLKRSISLISGLILLIDGLWLVAQDKLHFGIALPMVIGIALILYALFYTYLQCWQHASRLNQWLWNSLWSGFFLWILSVAMFFSYIQFSISSNDSAQPAAAILVLGSGIENGQPSPTLKSRLDTAAEYAKQHPAALIIMTGGLGFQEKFTEAEVMANYLHAYYPALTNPVVLEDRSNSTEQNFRHAQAILKQQNISLNHPIAIVTSHFHVPRARMIARHQGYQQVFSLSARTPLYIRYNSWLREYFAFISGWLLNEY